MRLDKDQQWKTVVDALAVALVAIDKSELHASKTNVEFAFSYAWRRWAEASRFPSIDPGSFHIYEMKSPRRVGAHGAFEWQPGSFNAKLIGGTEWWQPDELLGFVAKNGGLSAESLRTLATGFAQRAEG